MRSTSLRSAATIEARDAIVAFVLISAAAGAWLASRSPSLAHASLVGLRIVAAYCLSTG